MTYLVDTDWIIDGLAKVEQSLVILDRLADDGLAVSLITLGEVYEGAYSQPDPEATLTGYDQFVSGYQVLPLTDAIMRRFAQLRSRLRRQGNLIPDFDLVIAAICLEHNCTLVTRNYKHFGRVSELILYSPER